MLAIIAGTKRATKLITRYNDRTERRPTDLARHALRNVKVSFL